MSYAPDPGNEFESDVHRRTLAVVWLEGLDIHAIEEAVSQDDFNPVEDVEELVDVLKDLEADGHVEKDESGNWVRTASGHKALTGEDS